MILVCFGMVIFSSSMMWQINECFLFIYLFMYLLPPDSLLWAPPPRQTPSPATLVASPLPANIKNKSLTGCGLNHSLTGFSGSHYEAIIAFKVPTVNRNFSLPRPLLPEGFILSLNGSKLAAQDRIPAFEHHNTEQTHKWWLLEMRWMDKKDGSIREHHSCSAGVKRTFSSRALWCSNKDLRALRTSTSLETPEGDWACRLTTVMRRDRSCLDTRHSRCSRSNWKILIANNTETMMETWN